MDPRTDKLIRRTAMAGTVTAAYFLITADYGPQDHALLAAGKLARLILLKDGLRTVYHVAIRTFLVL
nr:PREDICTED: uncharacterized protein LOC103973537 isoform X2 [Musa acuminata subsp. malaccensis]